MQVCARGKTEGWLSCQQIASTCTPNREGISKWCFAEALCLALKLDLYIKWNILKFCSCLELGRWYSATRLQSVCNLLISPSLCQVSFWDASEQLLQGWIHVLQGGLVLFQRFHLLHFILFHFCYTKNGCYFCISGCNISKKLCSFYFPSAIARVCLLKNIQKCCHKNILSAKY